MRHFIYFSRHAQTSGNFSDLMKAGRMDIAIHVLIASIFLSHDVREDTKVHLVFYGMPDPPKHIEIQANPELDISKKDVATLIKKILYKYRKDQKTEVLPGCFVEKKSLMKVIEELSEQGNEIFLLDKQGEDIRDAEMKKDCVFILGDHKGIPKKELKRIKSIANVVSLGPKMYFASHVVAIVNNELDRRGI
ncbi:MAG: tRNA (pseudouridine(54)-N(1))-methyltransferase TrmY [Candidatus Nanoarchaeia archaeon]